MAVRSIPSPLPAYPAGSSHLSVKRIPSWGRRHRWAGLDDPGPDRVVNDGVITVVGDGSVTTFTWAHGLGSIPRYVHVDHPQSLPLPPFILGWDLTTISARFGDPPARNIDLRWFVQAAEPGETVVGVELIGGYEGGYEVGY